MAQFRVFGPVELLVAGHPQDLGPPKQRVVLAALVIDAGHPVSAETLIERVWADDPPRQPRNALYGHIARLRKLLQRAAATEQAEPGRRQATLVRRAGGYVLDVDPDCVDVHRFERLVAQAAGPDLDGEQQATRIREALELWREPPLADLSGPWVERTRMWLTQLYLDAFLAWGRAELRLGRPDRVIGQAQQLLAEHPMVEPLAVLLIQALHEAGRTAEALDRYETTRRLLADELGVDPGADLQDLHVAMLRGEPVPGSRARTAQAVQPAAQLTGPRQAPEPRPAELPPELVSLTGRDQEIAELVAFAERGGWGAGSATVCAIDGMPGVGKTALAVHAAHRLASAYPDGQLYLDLRGFTAGVAPLSPGDALERLLRAVGVPAALVPPDTDERAGLWRSRTAGRRYLLLLDNAVGAPQVRPLLTAAPESLTLVTSRQRLSTLDAAQHIALDVLELPEAIRLFRTLAGTERLADEPDALVGQLVQMCGRLPLAVRLLAGRLRHRPGWSLQDLVTRLRDRQRRLAELSSGSEGVAAAFRLSYEQLDAQRRRLYRLLSLQPGTDLGAYAAAALAGIEPAEAETALEALVDAHLLESRSLGQYYFHDLLRAHAGELVREEEPDGERSAAIQRLLDHYLHTLAHAMDAYEPAERHRRPAIAAAPSAATGPVFASADAAEGWLAAERANLVALVDHAVERQAIGALASLLFGYLNDRALYSDALRLHNKHLAAARAGTDPVDQARALYHLGETYYRLNRHDVALTCLDQADLLLPHTGDRSERAHVLQVRGSVLEDVGRFPEALACLTDAARLHHATGDRGGEARTLCALSELDRIFGRLERAEAHALRALELARSSADRLSEAAAHRFLGAVYVGMARYQEALPHCQESLRRYRGIGNQPRECLALVSAGNALRGLGRFGEAGERYREALSIACEIQNPNSELEARHALGEALRERGELTEAVDQLRKAAGLARELGQEYDQARAEHALGRAYLDLGDPAGAREHLSEGSAIFQRLGVPPEPAAGARGREVPRQNRAERR
ncbi:AfsR/SARP family transcriptional regulator [Flindersiella endophytica]